MGKTYFHLQIDCLDYLCAFKVLLGNGKYFRYQCRFFHSQGSTSSVPQTIVIFLVQYLRQHKATCCKS